MATLTDITSERKMPDDIVIVNPVGFTELPHLKSVSNFMTNLTTLANTWKSSSRNVHNQPSRPFIPVFQYTTLAKAKSKVTGTLHYGGAYENNIDYNGKVDAWHVYVRTSRYNDLPMYKRDKAYQPVNDRLINIIGALDPASQWAPWCTLLRMKPGRVQDMMYINDMLRHLHKDALFWTFTNIIPDTKVNVLVVHRSMNSNTVKIHTLIVEYKQSMMLSNPSTALLAYGLYIGVTDKESTLLFNASEEKGEYGDRFLPDLNLPYNLLGPDESIIDRNRTNKQKKKNNNNGNNNNDDAVVDDDDYDDDEEEDANAIPHHKSCPPPLVSTLDIELQAKWKAVLALKQTIVAYIRELENTEKANPPPFYRTMVGGDSYAAGLTIRKSDAVSAAASAAAGKNIYILGVFNDGEQNIPQRQKLANYAGWLMTLTEYNTLNKTHNQTLLYGVDLEMNTEVWERLYETQDLLRDERGWDRKWIYEKWVLMGDPTTVGSNFNTILNVKDKNNKQVKKKAAIFTPTYDKIFGKHPIFVKQKDGRFTVSSKLAYVESIGNYIQRVGEEIFLDYNHLVEGDDDEEDDSGDGSSSSTNSSSSSSGSSSRGGGRGRGTRNQHNAGHTGRNKNNNTNTNTGTKGAVSVKSDPSFLSMLYNRWMRRHR